MRRDRNWPEFNDRGAGESKGIPQQLCAWGGKEIQLVLSGEPAMQLGIYRRIKRAVRCNDAGSLSKTTEMGNILGGECYPIPVDLW